MQRRALQVRSRVVIRAWEYRQRRHAKGAWFRLRRVLVDARSAYAIPLAEGERLVAEGARPELVGQEFFPPKLIVFVSQERVDAVAERRPVPLWGGSELLAAPCVGLVPLGE